MAAKSLPFPNRLEKSRTISVHSSIGTRFSFAQVSDISSPPIESVITNSKGGEASGRLSHTTGAETDSVYRTANKKTVAKTTAFYSSFVGSSNRLALSPRKAGMLGPP
jgi:hypothetical protein